MPKSKTVKKKGPIRKPVRVKGKPAPKKANVKKALTKGAATRERILAAALKVFARHSYNSGSMRMIGKEGGFDHMIIRYHFKSKAELFEAVLEKATQEFRDSHASWFKGLAGKTREKGFSLFLDRMLAYTLKHPEVLRLFVKNLSQPDKSNVVPGYQYIPDFLAQTRDVVMAKIPIKSSRNEFDRYIVSFNIHLFCFVGAASVQAALLGLDPKSRKYRKWVKDTLMYLYLPHFKKLINPDSNITI